MSWRDVTFALVSQQTTTLGDASANGTSFSSTSSGQGVVIHTPFRAHLKLNGVSSADSTEYIIDGDDYYLKLPSVLLKKGQKPWLKFAGLGRAASDAYFLQGGDLAHLVAYDKITQPRLVGTESIDGHATWHIHGMLNNTSKLDGIVPGNADTGTEDVWLAQDTLLPVKMNIALKDYIAANASRGITQSITLAQSNTYRFLAWDSGIHIALPPANQVTSSFSPTAVPTPTP